MECSYIHTWVDLALTRMEISDCETTGGGAELFTCQYPLNQILGVGVIQLCILGYISASRI